MAYIQLQLNSLSVTFEQFFSDTLPRIDAQTEPGITYTATGNVVVAGPVYETYALWTVDAPCTLEQFEQLRLIKLESDRRRRTGGNPNILVYDTTQPHQELAPRTRAIVPATAVTTIGSYVSYFAQYNAVLSAIEGRAFGRGRAVRFTMQETDKIAA